MRLCDTRHASSTKEKKSQCVCVCVCECARNTFLRVEQGEKEMIKYFFLSRSVSFSLLLSRFIKGKELFIQVEINKFSFSIVEKK